MQNAGISTVLATNAKYFIPNNDLKVGQIVIGNVNELAEDGTARVIINGKIITANVVEETLSKGKFYFEVKNIEEGKVELKVISELKQNDPKTILQILNELELPVTKESEALIKLFLQAERPISKSEVMEALNQLMKMTNKQAGFDTISFLLKKNYPISQTFIETLDEGLKLDFPSIFSNIDSLPEEVVTSPELKQLQSMIGILKNSTSISNFLTEQYVETNQILNATDQNDLLLENWNNKFSVKHVNDVNSFKQEAIQNLFKLAQSSPTVAKMILSSLSNLPEYFGAKNDLKRIPLNLANIPFNALDSEIVDDQNRNLFQPTKDIIKDFNSKISNFHSIITHNEEVLSVLSNVLTNINENGKLSDLTKLLLQNQIVNDMKLNKNDLINDLFHLLNKFEIPNQEISSEHIFSIVKSHHETLGFDFENKISLLSELNKVMSDEQFPNLKEMTLKVLDSNLPDQMKKPIEQLLTKITSGQLVLTHQNGPEFQMTSAVPIHLPNWSTDLFIQWSGKENQQNQKEIESNYCHILFFLELETLKETMVDVSIQNRIINIKIFNNESQLNALITAAFPSLKESLAIHQFQLSSIKCLPFNKEQEQKVTELKYNNSLLSSREYAGVDLLI